MTSRHPWKHLAVTLGVGALALSALRPVVRHRDRRRRR